MRECVCREEVRGGKREQEWRQEGGGRREETATSSVRMGGRDGDGGWMAEVLFWR